MTFRLGTESKQERHAGGDGDREEDAAHVGEPVADIRRSTDGDLQQFVGDAVECANNDQPPCLAPGKTVASVAVEEKQEIQAEVGQEVKRLVGDFFERFRDFGKMSPEEHQPPIDDEEYADRFPMSLKPVKHLIPLLVQGVS